MKLAIIRIKGQVGLRKEIESYLEKIKSIYGNYLHEEVSQFRILYNKTDNALKKLRRTISPEEISSFEKKLLDANEKFWEERAI